MYPFLAILGLAISGGIFFVLVVLPAMGDAIGTVMYSSGAVIEKDKGLEAAAKIASGDYEGAIREYEKMYQEKPEDPFPVSEIAKIHSDKLQNYETALQVLQQHLEEKDWPEDNAAFLMFRMVDVHMHHGAFAEAKDILEQIVGNFPGTRHSANGKHKIHELEQLEFKEIQAQRARESAQS